MERNRKRGKRDYRDQKEIEAEIEREMCKKIMPIKFRSKEIHMDNEIDQLEKNTGNDGKKSQPRKRQQKVSVKNSTSAQKQQNYQAQFQRDHKISEKRPHTESNKRGLLATAVSGKRQSFDSDCQITFVDDNAYLPNAQTLEQHSFIEQI